MSVILDEALLEDLLTRLSAVEQANACLARQLTALYAQLSASNSHGEGKTLAPEQLSPVQDSMHSLSIAVVREQNSNFAKLTAREIQILRLVAQGLSDAEIATRLVITRRTVNWFLTSIYGKLGVSSRSAATRYLYEQQSLEEKDL